MKHITIIWTKHAIERQKEWDIKVGITKEEVENVISKPEQIVKGDLNVQIAQSKKENGLIRVPFIHITEGIKILTIYWTSKIEKYWRE